MAIWLQTTDVAFAGDDGCRSILPEVSTELRRPGSGFFGRMAGGVERGIDRMGDLLLLRHLGRDGILVPGSGMHLDSTSLDPAVRSSDVFLLFQGNSREPVHLIPRPELGPNHAYLRSGDHFYAVELNLNAPDLARYRVAVGSPVEPEAPVGYRNLAPPSQPLSPSRSFMTRPGLSAIALGALVGRFGLEPTARQQVNPLSFEFARIQPGTYRRGSPAHESPRHSDETQHTVHLTEGFEIGRTQVTQALWYSVMGVNPSRFRETAHSDGHHTRLGNQELNLNHPVENVGWNEVQEFIRRLNALDPDYTYRLPTEAEWEYAARAGTETAYPHGDDPAHLDNHAWHWNNSGGRTHAVATRNPNPRGLYDVGGNVWEWTQDWYQGDYPTGEVTNPTGPTSGSNRVVLGGSWYNNPGFLRSASRGHDFPSYRYEDVGFRLVRTARSRH